jgi:pimeloyl-ACP methyl ester carboxylesterase
LSERLSVGTFSVGSAVRREPQILSIPESTDPMHLSYFARSAALLTLCAASLVACGSSSNAPSSGVPSASRARFVVVPGSWQGAWAWSAVAAGLKAQGADVSVVELPAHGADTTPLSGATLDAYVAKVESVIEEGTTPVTLVGHSMGGIVISAVAEQHADKIAKLVYVSAFVVKDGETLLSLAQQDADSHLGPVLVVDQTAGTAGIPDANLNDAFCQDCSVDQLAALHANYRIEPLAPLATPVHVTAANWGKVEKFYVYTKQDHAVSYTLQQKMTAGVTFAKTAALDTSHSASLSNPTALTTALLGF